MRPRILISVQRYELAVRFEVTDGGRPARGSNSAPIELIEFSDFQCPFCQRANPTVEQVLKTYGDRIKFVYRHFPLEDVHPHALLAAEAAECAGAQGKFWQMHELLFANQEHLKLKNLHGYAEQLGLDMALYTSEMDDHVYLQRVREHIDSGLKSGVRGTPGFFINGRIQDVSFGIRSLFDAVEAAIHHHR